MEFLCVDVPTAQYRLVCLQWFIIIQKVQLFSIYLLQFVRGVAIIRLRRKYLVNYLPDFAFYVIIIMLV